MTANERWLSSVGKDTGLWIAQGLSETIVSSGEFPEDIVSKYKPKPGYYPVKYGGDWGGMWGNPQAWGQLSPKHTDLKIVPYLYLRPEHWRSYPEMVGGLLSSGYPAVILNVEMEWIGFETTFATLLSELNTANNLIGVAGFAWFNGWPDDGRAFASAIRSYDVVYLPEVYLSYFDNPKQGLRVSYEYLTYLLPDTPLVGVYDPTAVQAGMALPMPHIIGGSGWYVDTYEPGDWRTLVKLWQNPPDISTIITEPISTTDQINTALGQGLEYCSQLSAYWTEKPHLKDVNTENLLAAIETTLHTARKLNGGE